MHPYTFVHLVLYERVECVALTAFGDQASDSKKNMLSIDQMKALAKNDSVPDQVSTPYLATCSRSHSLESIATVSMR